MSIRRILGIDPGSRQMGIGVIDSNGQRSTHIYSACLRLHRDSLLPDRLGKIFAEVTSIIQQYQPQEMAIENVFVATNAGGALKLGQARGAAICAGVVAGLTVAEYSPREIKQATVGKGSADKTQVQHMIKYMLGLHGTLQADAADALAIALCHAHVGHINQRLAQASTRPSS